METKAFNGDYHLLQRVTALKEKWGLTHFIETGTYMGDTTAAMAAIFPDVLTCESNQTYLNMAMKQIAHLDNVHAVLSDSRNFIRGITPIPHNSLIFLDAHWNADVPLKGELQALAEQFTDSSSATLEKHWMPQMRNIASRLKKHKPIIIIHDFFVPGKSTVPQGPFGYDVYGSVTFNWDYVGKEVEAIYGQGGFTLTYPEEVAGAQRGYVVIEPC